MTFIEARPLSQERADFLEGYRSPRPVRIRRECHHRDWREVFEQLVEMLNGDEVVQFWTARANPPSFHRVNRPLSMSKAAVGARRRTRERRREEQARARTERALAAAEKKREEAWARVIERGGQDVEVIGGVRVRLESYAEAAQAQSWLDLVPEVGP